MSTDIKKKRNCAEIEKLSFSVERSKTFSHFIIETLLSLAGRIPQRITDFACNMCAVKFIVIWG